MQVSLALTNVTPSSHSSQSRANQEWLSIQLPVVKKKFFFKFLLNFSARNLFFLRFLYNSILFFIMKDRKIKYKIFSKFILKVYSQGISDAHQCLDLAGRHKLTHITMVIPSPYFIFSSLKWSYGSITYFYLLLFFSYHCCFYCIHYENNTRTPNLSSYSMVGSKFFIGKTKKTKKKNQKNKDKRTILYSNKCNGIISIIINCLFLYFCLFLFFGISSSSFIPCLILVTLQFVIMKVYTVMDKATNNHAEYYVLQ